MKALLIVLALGGLVAAGFSGTAVDPSCLRDGPEYIGADGCKKCHFTQWMSWKKTEMAKAFDSLKPGEAAEAKAKHGLEATKDYTKDATCVACHVTGYGKPGGYPAIEEGKTWSAEEAERAKSMEGVQCESCHGPGSQTAPFKKDNEQYKKADVLKLGMVEPNAENCAQCHNSKNPTAGDDYKLDYEALTKDDKKIHKHKKLKYEH